MEIIHYFAHPHKEPLIKKIAACNWSAARYLAKLLRTDSFFSALGGEGDLFVLMDGSELVSFATLTRQDCIPDESLTPWIGFVYTAPQYRGNGYAGRPLAHAEAVAAARGHSRVYLSTDHVGLYERYGYQYLENRIDCWGNDERILYKDLKGDHTMRTIRSMEDKYLLPSAQLVEAVFTAHENAREGKLVRALVEEIRSKEFYLPELELVMVDETDAVIGYVMFSRFHLEGKYLGELLLLSPAAVKTDLQRQHISKALIEYGFEKAKELGYKAVIVEGNPNNYRARGFVTSADYGIVADESIHLPAPECLMVKELVPGALAHIQGTVVYGYDSLVGANDK